MARQIALPGQVVSLGRNSIIVGALAMFVDVQAFALDIGGGAQTNGLADDKEQHQADQA